jgi:hypothetical protein
MLGIVRHTRIPLGGRNLQATGTEYIQQEPVPAEVRGTCNCARSTVVLLIIDSINSLLDKDVQRHLAFGHPLDIPFNGRPSTVAV